EEDQPHYRRDGGDLAERPATPTPAAVGPGRSAGQLRPLRHRARQGSVLGRPALLLGRRARTLEPPVGALGRPVAIFRRPVGTLGGTGGAVAGAAAGAVRPRDRPVGRSLTGGQPGRVVHGGRPRDHGGG